MVIVVACCSHSSCQCCVCLIRGCGGSCALDVVVFEVLVMVVMVLCRLL